MLQVYYCTSQKCDINLVHPLKNHYPGSLYHMRKFSLKPTYKVWNTICDNSLICHNFFPISVGLTLGRFINKSTQDQLHIQSIRQYKIKMRMEENTKIYIYFI